MSWCVYVQTASHINLELSFHGRKGLQGHQTEDRTEKRAARAKTGCFCFLPLSLLNLPDLTNRFTGFIKL